MYESDSPARPGPSPNLKGSKGTYALLLYCAAKRHLAVGRLGRAIIRPGYYLYVGSAFGPGGIAARTGRHLKTGKPLRWHIDYLREIAHPVEIWFTPDPVKREHQWSRMLAETFGLSAPIAGFGASDCRCPAHLFYNPAKPDFERFRAEMIASLPDHSEIFWEIKTCFFRNS
ncbi:MAG: GIY-YIG nuclease family protein [Gammaproteobacteria bacterium]